MSKWNSRKLIAVGMTAALAAINNQVNLFTPDILEDIINLVMVYLGAEGSADAIRAFRASAPSPGGSTNA